MTSCGYDALDDPFVKTILDQNIQGEGCAIRFYKKPLGPAQREDPVTYNIVLQILQDRVEHEEDLQALSEDLENDDEGIRSKQFKEECYGRDKDRHF